LSRNGGVALNPERGARYGRVLSGSLSARRIVPRAAQLGLLEGKWHGFSHRWSSCRQTVLLLWSFSPIRG